MALMHNISADGNEVVITPGERFDFSIHREFREAYRNQNPTVRYVVNLANTEFMDSSALGMLLLLREYGGGEKARICIQGANSYIQKILLTANFGRLFEIA